MPPATRRQVPDLTPERLAKIEAKANPDALELAKELHDIGDIAHDCTHGVAFPSEIKQFLRKLAAYRRAKA